MELRKSTSLVALFAGLCLASPASAFQIDLDLEDSYYLGSITDGIPPSDENQLNWLNEIIGMSNGDTMPSTNPAGESLFRYDNGFTDLDDAVAGNKQEDDGTRTVGSTSVYVMGKYGKANGPDQVTYLWYIGDVPEGTVLKLNDARDGLSHTTLFSSTTTVPYGGTTVALFGLSLLGFGVVLRKLKA